MKFKKRIAAIIAGVVAFVAIGIAIVACVNTKRTVTVTWWDNEQQLQQDTLNRDSYITSYPDTKKDGFNFIDWYADKSLETKFDFKIAINKDTDIYGKWMEITEQHVHDLVEHVSVPSTCNIQGNSAYWSCEECGKYFSDADANQKIEENSWMLPFGNHNLKHIPAQNASCINNGNKEYWECENCEKYFEDSNGETEIQDKTSVVILAEHKWELHSDGTQHWYECKNSDAEKNRSNHFGYEEDGECDECGYNEFIKVTFVFEEGDNPVKAPVVKYYEVGYKLVIADYPVLDDDDGCYVVAWKDGDKYYVSNLSGEPYDYAPALTKDVTLTASLYVKVSFYDCVYTNGHYSGENRFLITWSTEKGKTLSDVLWPTSRDTSSYRYIVPVGYRYAGWTNENGETFTANSIFTRNTNLIVKYVPLNASEYEFALVTGGEYNMFDRVTDERFSDDSNPNGDYYTIYTKTLYLETGTEFKILEKAKGAAWSSSSIEFGPNDISGTNISSKNGYITVTASGYYTFKLYANMSGTVYGSGKNKITVTYVEGSMPVL